MLKCKKNCKTWHQESKYIYITWIWLRGSILCTGPMVLRGMDTLIDWFGISGDWIFIWVPGIRPKLEKYNRHYLPIMETTYPPLPDIILDKGQKYNLMNMIILVMSPVPTDPLGWWPYHPNLKINLQDYHKFLKFPLRKIKSILLFLINQEVFLPEHINFSNRNQERHHNLYLKIFSGMDPWCL